MRALLAYLLHGGAEGHARHRYATLLPDTATNDRGRVCRGLFAAVTLDAFAAYPTRLTAARVTAHYASL